MTQQELNQKIKLHQRWIHTYKNGERLVLPWQNLTGLDFSHRNLSAERAGPICGGERLQGANFITSDLTSANFTRSRLTWAEFTWADLTSANFTSAILTSANFSCAFLTKANFSKAGLHYAEFTGAKLIGADLTLANLAEANFHLADLTEAKISGADFSGANLEMCKGIVWADCSFTGHWESGRRLLGVLIDGDIQYFCGCFKGSESALLEHINRLGDERYKESRLLAFEFVKESIEMSLSSKEKVKL